MVTIASYRDQHQKHVTSLILSIQAGEYGLPITINDQPDLQQIPAFYQKAHGNFWVALDHENVVGTIALLDIGNGQAALRKMFVDKRYRGQGIATALLTTLLDWCATKGIHDIYLGTTSLYHDAHQFYEKRGFKEIEKAELPVTFPIMHVDTKFYRYRL